MKLATPLYIGLLGLVTALPLHAAVNNFETDGGGMPFVGLGDSFTAGEYAGLLFTDSDPAVGSSFVNLTNPLNVGTDISGYYVNVGAFASQPQTFLNIDFLVPVSLASFDFATPSGDISVFAFLSGGGVVFNPVSGTGTFINQAGFTVDSGSALVSGIGDIDRLLILAAPSEALIVDNLNFALAPVPEPESWAMLAAGLGLVLARVRRRVA